MRAVSIVASVAVLVCAGIAQVSEATPMFYSLDSEQPPGHPMKLVTFPSNPGDGLNVIVIADVPALPSDPVGANMDLSNDGRLFVAPQRSNVIYAIDPNTGVAMGSASITGDSNDHISGVAVSNGGMLYINQDLNPGSRLWSVNFDTKQATVLMTTSTKVDDIDFDGQGNLIGEDLNDSGNMYRLPLDGSQPIAIGNLGIQPVTVLTYSAEDDSFYFKAGATGQTLYRVAWSNGQPGGPFEQIDTIGPGHYAGLAAIPEPATLSLLCLGGLAVVHRSKK